MKMHECKNESMNIGMADYFVLYVTSCCFLDSVTSDFNRYFLLQKNPGYVQQNE